MERLAEILEERQPSDNVPDVMNSEDPKLAGYRMGLGLRRPSQRAMLSQIFGEPENEEERALQRYFRIKKEPLE